jgi:hypothetical protein
MRLGAVLLGGRGLELPGAEPVNQALNGRKWIIG